MDNVRQAVRRIAKMAQRELQLMFERVYGVRSSSNNNLWLRKKLIEGASRGLVMGCRGVCCG